MYASKSIPGGVTYIHVPDIGEALRLEGSEQLIVRCC